MKCSNIILYYDEFSGKKHIYIYAFACRYNRVQVLADLPDL